MLEVMPHILTYGRGPKQRALKRPYKYIKQTLAPEQKREITFFSRRLCTSGFLLLCRMSSYLLSLYLHLWAHNITMTRQRTMVIAAIFRHRKC